MWYKLNIMKMFYQLAIMKTFVTERFFELSLMPISLMITSLINKMQVFLTDSDNKFTAEGE